MVIKTYLKEYGEYARQEDNKEKFVTEFRSSLKIDSPIAPGVEIIDNEHEKYLGGYGWQYNDVLAGYRLTLRFDRFFYYTARRGNRMQLTGQSRRQHK